MANREPVVLISGGQTGVDQAALRAAQARGLQTDGWCPPGRQCDGGLIPTDLVLRETPAERSRRAPDTPRSLRSEWNVRDSDATLVLRPEQDPEIDPGTAWTITCASELYRRPLLICDPFDPQSGERIREWLGRHAVVRLNVAGPSERRTPGIGEATYYLLLDVLPLTRDVRRGTPAS
jgi:hypothetical protein